MPKKAPEKIGSVLRVPLSQLHPHPQNPFAVRDDSAMQELKESVSQNGVLVPAIARPRAEGGYELIAGHRRKYACEQAVVSCVQIVFCDGNDYITEYREYKGDEIPFSEPVPDLLDFVDRLESLCPDEYHPDEVVIYET